MEKMPNWLNIKGLRSALRKKNIHLVLSNVFAFVMCVLHLKCDNFAVLKDSKIVLLSSAIKMFFDAILDLFDLDIIT